MQPGVISRYIFAKSRPNSKHDGALMRISAARGPSVPSTGSGPLAQLSENFTLRARDSNQ